MSSLVELKNACVEKALELCQSIDATDSEFEEKSRGVVNLTNAACMADAQANSDAWARSQAAGKEPSRG